MNVRITEWTDREAAQYLGVTYATIRNGVKRGALTRVQKAGVVQHVAKEQVELFLGKRLLLGELAPGELKKWQAINDALSAPAPAQAPAQTLGEPVSIEDMRRAEETVRFLARIGEMFRGEAQTSPLPVASKGESRIERLQSYFNDEGEFEQALGDVMGRAFASFESGDVDAGELEKFFEDLAKNGTSEEKVIGSMVVGAPVAIFLLKMLMDWLRSKNILPGSGESAQSDQAPAHESEEPPVKKKRYA